MQKRISPEIDNIGGGKECGDHDGVLGEAQHPPGATPHSSPLPRQNENTQCILSYDTWVWLPVTQAFAMNLF